MRCVGSAFLLALALLAEPAVAQRPDRPSLAFIAETEAAHVALTRAENLLNGGEKRGPDSRACASMNEFLLHYVEAAITVGAVVRPVGWTELTLREQAAVKEKTSGPWARHTKLLTHACTEAL